MGLPGLEVFPDSLRRPNKSSRQKPKSDFRTLVGVDPVFTTGGVGWGNTRGQWIHTLQEFKYKPNIWFNLTILSLKTLLDLK